MWHQQWSSYSTLDFTKSSEILIIGLYLIIWFLILSCPDSLMDLSYKKQNDHIHVLLMANEGPICISFGVHIIISIQYHISTECRTKYILWCIGIRYSWLCMLELSMFELLDSLNLQDPCNFISTTFNIYQRFKYCRIC